MARELITEIPQLIPIIDFYKSIKLNKTETLSALINFDNKVAVTCKAIGKLFLDYWVLVLGGKDIPNAFPIFFTLTNDCENIYHVLMTKFTVVAGSGNDFTLTPRFEVYDKNKKNVINRYFSITVNFAEGFSDSACLLVGKHLIESLRQLIY